MNAKESYKLNKQIIRRKVKAIPTSVGDKYYKQVKASIKRRILPETESVIIIIEFKAHNIRPFVAEAYLKLQREFTSIIVYPENSVLLATKELLEFEKEYECTVINAVDVQ